MRNKSHKNHRLRMRRETLRALGDGAMALARGGVFDPYSRNQSSYTQPTHDGTPSCPLPYIK